MDAVEFCKTVNRLCKNKSCKECPVYKDECCMVGFDDDSIKSIDETVSKVEKFQKSRNGQKTTPQRPAKASF